MLRTLIIEKRLKVKFNPLKLQLEIFDAVNIPYLIEI